jgi:anhydro-N-acetylmuramic acid kinase
LLAHAYFAQPIPKSTGREDFNLDWLQQQLMAFGQVSAVDVQATLQALTAQSVAQAVRQTGLNGGELVLCGGGALNSALWQRLAAALPDWQLISTAALGLAPTWVEAAAFAWLAQQRLQMQAGNLPRVTGAQGGRVLGAIYAGAS